MPFSLLVAARAHRQPRQALFYPAGMAPSTPEHRQGQASGPDRAAKCSCCAHHFSVHLGAPRQRLLSGAHGAVCLVFFISVLFLDFTCPAQCASLSHSHMRHTVYTFFPDRTGYDLQTALCRRLPLAAPRLGSPDRPTHGDSTRIGRRLGSFSRASCSSAACQRSPMQAESTLNDVVSRGATYTCGVARRGRFARYEVPAIGLPRALFVACR